MAYPSGTQAIRPPYVNNPVVILSQGDADSPATPTSLTTDYARSARRLDWWFPEDYKEWTWASIGKSLLNASSWRAVWDWEIATHPIRPP